MITAFLLIDCDSNNPTIRCSVRFFENMSVAVRSNIYLIPSEIYKHLTDGVITCVSQAVNLLALAKSLSLEESPIDPKIYIDRAISNLLLYTQSTDSTENCKIFFFIEQLKLLQVSKQRITYSPNTPVTASNWNSINPHCYKQMLRSNLLTLPSISTLHRISNVLSVESSNAEMIKYLEVKIKNLEKDEKERFVILLIDS